jgi:hypothetical protein
MATLTERLAEKLGLPPGADEQAVNNEIMRLCHVQAEDFVSAAISGGTILAAHRDYWSNAFKTDHEGTKAVLRSLMAKAKTPVVQPAPAPITPYQPPDPEAAVTDEDEAVLGRLGVRGVKPPPNREPAAMLRNEDGTPFASKKYRGY